MPFPQGITDRVNEQNEINWAQYALEIDRSQLVGIVDQVRTLVLDWALNLEKAGIIGTGYSFERNSDRQKAQSAQMSIHIGSIGTLTGNVGSGNVSGDISASIMNLHRARQLAEQVERHTGALVEEGVSPDELRQTLAELQRALRDENPDTGIIRGLLVDLRSIVTGAAGNLVASGVIATLNHILGTGVPS